MNEGNNTTPELGLINIGGGAFCRVKKVTVVCDITDADDYAAECPVTCLLTPRDIEKSYEENGFFDADEGERGAK